MHETRYLLVGATKWLVHRALPVILDLFSASLNNVPELNLYMEYTDKNCLESILKLFRNRNLKVLNMEITRSSSSEKHNACAIFSIRLNKNTRFYNFSDLPGLFLWHGINCDCEE